MSDEKWIVGWDYNPSKELHEWRFRLPANWITKARQLRHAASKLRKDMIKFNAIYEYVFEPWLMMSACSLEVAFKGAILAKQAAQPAVEFPKSKGGHDLVALAKAADVSFDEHEAKLLEWATESILSFGRFPFPKEGEPHRSWLSHNFHMKRAEAAIDRPFNDAIARAEVTTKEADEAHERRMTTGNKAQAEKSGKSA